MSSPEYVINGERRPRNWLTWGLVGLGAAVVVVTVAVLANTLIALAGEWPEHWRWQILLMAILLVLALTAVVLVIGALAGRRQMARVAEQIASLEQRTAIIAEQAVAGNREPAAVPVPRMDPAELRGVLLEIRDILLLPQDQRVRRYQLLLEAEFQRRLAATDRFIASRDFHRARDELTALSDRFEMDDRIRDARNRLERAADEARAQDISQAAMRAQELIGQAKWAEAEHLARELADKYPAAAEPAALLERVVRERKNFEQRNRQHMLDEIQQLVHQRRWQEAAGGTRKFLEMFPNDIEAPPLREQLKTLDANANIQIRQQLEQHYKELIAQHRYWDAVGLANQIIARYPMSPQANALRGQIGRLEELARRHEPQQ